MKTSTPTARFTLSGLGRPGDDHDEQRQQRNEAERLGRRQPAFSLDGASDDHAGTQQPQQACESDQSQRREKLTE